MKKVILNLINVLFEKVVKNLNKITKFKLT